MYIEKINDFLQNYKNIKKEIFLEILNKANTGNFILSKLEKDFVLTLILIKFGEKYPDLIFKGGTFGIKYIFLILD